MQHKNNYLDVSAVAYPPKLKLFRNILMLTLDQQNEIAEDTNDACLRLFEYYIQKKTWKHFNPTNYENIGKSLRWTASKTKKCKDMLVKAGYLYVKKDTLPDKTKIYRIFLGQEVVALYNETKNLPPSKEEITYDSSGLQEFAQGKING